VHARYLREKARELRLERKLTIDQLAERLALPRTTVYYWVRDLPIPYMSPGRQAALPHLRRGNLRMQEKYRRLRDDAHERGRAEFAQRADDPSFRDFVVLYLAEGYKRNRNVVSICNSDVAVLRVSLPWMEHFGGGSFEYSVQYHADQDLDELREYWGRELQIRPDEIRLQRKSNSGRLSKRTWRSPYGVLAIRCNDTLFRARLEGWMDCLRHAWLDSP
jgi:excisionase family DNA binding protein